MHRKVPEPARVWHALAKEDVHDVSAVNDREEYVLKLYSLCDRDIRARRDVRSVCIVNRKVPGLVDVCKRIVKIAFDHILRAF
jgi:hypothetical protein